MDALIWTLSSLPLSDIIPIIEKDRGMNEAFRRYVMSGYYVADITGELDTQYLPDLEKALPVPVTEEGYPKSYHLVLDLYKHGLLDKLPSQVEEMVIGMRQYRIPEILRNDKIFIMKKSYLTYASDRLKDDKEFVISMMAFHADRYRNDEMFRDASDRLRDDEDVLGMAMSTNPGSVIYASDRLKRDRNIALLAARHGVLYDVFMDDDEIVLTAIAANPRAIKHASDRFKRDRNIALDVVSREGYALEYLPDHFKDDEEIVTAALKNQPNAFVFVSPRLRRNRRFLWTLM